MAKIFVDLLSYTGLKGGMEKYVRELYASIGALDTGHTFVAWASKELAAMGAPWFPGEVINSGITGENRFIWAWGELFRAGPAAARVGADLLHCPLTLGPRKTAMPAVYTMHDLLYFALPELMVTPMYNKPVQWMEKVASRNAARIITDSQASLEDIVTYLKFPAERIDVVSLAGTPPTARRVATKDREQALFLAMGQRIGHKNWAGLVRSLVHIDESRRPKVVITGARGPDPLAPIIADLGLQEWVDLRSWVPDDEVAWLLEHATALVIPGLHDGTSLPALEAMYLGLPVLMSDISEFREIAGDAAGYFDPKDPASIAATLERAMAEPEWLASLSAKGLVQTKLFTWERTARETLAVFDKARGLA